MCDEIKLSFMIQRVITGMTRLTFFSGEAIVLEDLGDSHDGTNGCMQPKRIDAEKQCANRERIMG
jgi:hypothetical protein